ncbi:MAG: hypothetical protein ABSC21_21415 [Terriglobia bacterium]|jgi:hypothetical protein
MPGTAIVRPDYDGLSVVSEAKIVVNKKVSLILPIRRQQVFPNYVNHYVEFVYVGRVIPIHFAVFVPQPSKCCSVLRMCSGRIVAYSDT